MSWNPIERGPIEDICEIVPAWPDAMTEDEWLEARKLGIGGSEIGTICGLNPYQSKYNLWACKKNLVEGFKGNEATDLGHLLEPAVAERYATVTNSAIVTWPVILRPKANGFMSGNVDRFIVTPSDDFPAGKVTYWETTEPPPRIIALLECKTGGMVSPGKPQSGSWVARQFPPATSYRATGTLPRLGWIVLNTLPCWVVTDSKPAPYCVTTT